MFKNEVIDRYDSIYYTELQKQKQKNAQVCIYSLADLYIGHCVKLTLLGGGGSLNGFLRFRYKNLFLN